MITADWVALIIIAVSVLLGLLLGFGKGLKFFTSGIFGIIISVFVCYCLGGLILKLGFVQELLIKFRSLWATKSGGFYKFLDTIRVDIIVYYIALFFIVQILRIIIVGVLKGIAEADNKPLRIINKILGAAFFTAVIVLLGLTVLQIITWMGGSAYQSVQSKLAGSALKLDKLLVNNPLLSIPKIIKHL